ncbi:MAG: GGDEF domain-containing protein [Desulfuromonadaceae bacterium]|nr:GGDEF domain-containing protein [Desulfuromonadaceae bacterium]
MSVSRVIISLLLPGGLVVALALGLFAWQPRPSYLQSFLSLLPWLVIAFGALLGWRFRRSRLLLMLLMVMGTERLLAALPAGSPVFYTLAWLRLLLPLNLLWWQLVAESELLSVACLRRLLFILGQVLLPLVLWFSTQGQLWYWIQHDWLLPQPLSSYCPTCCHPIDGCTTQALIAMALCLLTALIRFLRQPGPERGAQLWLVGLAGCALFWPTFSLPWRNYLLQIAALVPVIALLESSHAMAYRDELTGLNSRRALMEFLQRLRGHYTLVMVDIDHFKSVNDTHGHDVGDQVLKRVASLLAQVTGGGRAYRYGGEEFTLIFPRRRREPVLSHLESLRQRIEDTPFVIRGTQRPRKNSQGITKRSRSSRADGQKNLQITVSMGVAEGRGIAPDLLFKQADQALYRAKKTGRNRIC